MSQYELLKLHSLKNQAMLGYLESTKATNYNICTKATRA
jgi:hypothetical protein